MFDQNRFRNYRTNAARPSESSKSNDEMNEKDDKITHLGIVSKPQNVWNSAPFVIRQGQALEYLPPEELAEKMRNYQFTKLTPKTMVSKGELLAELEWGRGRGYSITDQQCHLDTLSIAAPIFGADGKVRASVGIAGSRLSPAVRKMASLIASVKEAGQEIFKTLARMSAWEARTDLLLPAATRYDALRDKAMAGEMVTLPSHVRQRRHHGI